MVVALVIIDGVDHSWINVDHKYVLRPKGLDIDSGCSVRFHRGDLTMAGRVGKIGDSMVPGGSSGERGVGISYDLESASLA